MSILIFLVVLAVLVFVHELGHFIAAKRSGIRVDEFSIGFPPRLFSWKRGETTYSLNLIPFGGYVKIFGENPDDESMTGPDSTRSFVNRPKWIQTIVLSAGVLGNIIFAWMLISLGFSIGMPMSADGYAGPGTIENPRLLITYLEQGAPAAEAGLRAGDEIAHISSRDVSINAPKPGDVQDIIRASGGEEVTFAVLRGGKRSEIAVLPEEGIVTDVFAVGITMDRIGTLQLPIHQAILHGGIRTVGLVRDVAVGLYGFVADAFTFKADLSQVSGPVGIAGMVGEASELGFAYLISFTALISINLAVINLFPFPALDGGRILFVLIEKARGRAISPRLVNMLNGIGFALLIFLMVVVTYRDIIRLF